MFFRGYFYCLQKSLRRFEHEGFEALDDCLSVLGGPVPHAVKRGIRALSAVRHVHESIAQHLDSLGARLGLRNQHVVVDHGVTKFKALLFR